MRSSFRTTLVLAAAAALVLGSTSTASADTISTSSTDAAYDAATRTFTLVVGQTASADVTYVADATGKSGCDLTGRNSQVTYDTGSSMAGVVSSLTSSIQYTECGDETDPPVRQVTFTGSTPGTTVVSFAVASWTSNNAAVSASTFATAPASFTVVVLAPADGRDAPAIANDFLHNTADAETLAACQEANGTNAGQTNWHGQLISKIAQFFDGQTFTPDEEYVVVDKVLEYCGVGSTSS